MLLDKSTGFTSVFCHMGSDIMVSAAIGRKTAAIGRTHIGIYTVLQESFPPQRNSFPSKYIQYFSGSESPCEEKSSPQNCEALQNERFFLKTSEKNTARLTPAVIFWCGIVEKDPVWSV